MAAVEILPARNQRPADTEVTTHEHMRATSLTLSAKVSLDNEQQCTQRQHISRVLIYLVDLLTGDVASIIKARALWDIAFVISSTNNFWD